MHSTVTVFLFIKINLSNIIKNFRLYLFHSKQHSTKAHLWHHIININIGKLYRSICLSLNYHSLETYFAFYTQHWYCDNDSPHIHWKHHVFILSLLYTDMLYIPHHPANKTVYPNPSLVYFILRPVWYPLIKTVLHPPQPSQWCNCLISTILTM